MCVYVFKNSLLLGSQTRGYVLIIHDNDISFIVTYSSHTCSIIGSRFIVNITNKKYIVRHCDILCIRYIFSILHITILHSDRNVQIHTTEPCIVHITMSVLFLKASLVYMEIIMHRWICKKNNIEIYTQYRFAIEKPKTNLNTYICICI